MFCLSEKSQRILLEILKKNHANSTYISLIEENNISIQYIDIYREYICDEFLQVGLNENDEPNSYGIELEDIIDELGHIE